MNQICRAYLAFAATGSLLVGGCGDGNAPLDVNLRITVQTTGADQPNAYLLRTGDGTVQAVGAQVTLYRFLPPGTHELRLEGLASNCTVQGPESVQFTIQLGQINTVVFSVECRAVTGAVSVTAPTTGRDFDADGYSVEVTGQAGSAGAATVFPNQQATIAALAAGSYEVTLSGLSDNCQLIGPNSQTVSITVGGLTYHTASVAFSVECDATTGDVRLLTATTGDDPDPDGYTVSLDGVQLIDYGDYYYYYDPIPVRVPPNGERFFGEVAPGNRSYELHDLAPNCAVDGPNPRTVSVAVATVAEVLFQIVCTNVP